jgi:Transposase, Mutator family
VRRGALACPENCRSCKDIDERVLAILERSLEGEWPYLWLDATYLKQREGGRIVSVAAIIAMAVDIDGRREIVGLKVGPSEAQTFWWGFLKTLVRRGLKGVKLVISDAMRASRSDLRIRNQQFVPARVKDELGGHALAFETIIGRGGHRWRQIGSCSSAVISSRRPARLVARGSLDMGVPPPARALSPAL